MLNIIDINQTMKATSIMNESEKKKEFYYIKKVCVPSITPVVKFVVG